MLDFLRRRSQSFIIKIVLAGVILPFVLFYGFSQYNEEQSNPNAVASVNDREIPASIYRMTYEQILSNYRRSMQGAQVPDFLQKMAEQNAMRQLVQRELMIQAAEKNRVTVSEQELADFIVKNFARDGEAFDPVAYRHGFLPSINQKLGINYEDYIRDDLRVNHLFALFADVRLPWSLSNAQSSTWEFEKLSLNEQQLKEKGKLPAGKTVAQVAENFTAPKADWKNLSKKLGVEIKKLEAISLSERHLVQPELSLDDAAKIFQLTPGQAMILSGSNNLTVVRLLSKKMGAGNTPEWSFLDNWMQQSFAQAKITSNLSEQ